MACIVFAAFSAFKRCQYYSEGIRSQVLQDLGLDNVSSSIKYLYFKKLESKDHMNFVTMKLYHLHKPLL